MKLKIIMGLAILLLVVLALAVLVVGLNLGRIVKTGMERVGPKVTQTTLTVDSVEVSLFAGSASVKGLVLGNPEGYNSPQSISVGHASVKLVPGSVLSDKIIIRSIELKSPDITFEGNPLGKNNLTQLMANVNAMTGPVDQATTNAPTSAPAALPGQKKPARKFQVDDFVITGAKVHAHLTGLINQDVTLPLPDIHFTDLGTGTDGITAADLTKKVINEITVNTLKTLANSVAGLGKNALGTLKGAAQGLLDHSTNAVGEGVDNLKKGLGNLLGR